MCGRILNISCVTIALLLVISTDFTGCNKPDKILKNSISIKPFQNASFFELNDTSIPDYATNYRSDNSFFSFFAKGELFRSYELPENFLSDTLKLLPQDDYQKIIEKDRLKGGRIARWYFGWAIFRDYPLQKKIYGGGFDFLELYGKKFKAAKYDWPHNPFISAFLYSGIIGGLVFLWFMIMVIVNYLRYLKRHLLFFIIFLITFFFVFFSDTSIFNTPLFTFLCFVPYYTRYLFLKEKYNSSEEITIRDVIF